MPQIQLASGQSRISLVSNPPPSPSPISIISSASRWRPIFQGGGYFKWCPITWNIHTPVLVNIGSQQQYRTRRARCLDRDARWDMWCSLDVVLKHRQAWPMLDFRQKQETSCTEITLRHHTTGPLPFLLVDRATNPNSFFGAEKTTRTSCLPSANST